MKTTEKQHGYTKSPDEILTHKETAGQRLIGSIRADRSRRPSRSAMKKPSRPYIPITSEEKAELVEIFLRAARRKKESEQRCLIIQKETHHEKCKR